MSQVMQLELLKEIPGYKAILKSVIKTQIQLLIEQLSEQTGEESIILTACINEGTLSNLGSHMGKGFFEGRDEIKSQFLGYCLKNQPRNDVPQKKTPYQADHTSDIYQPGPSQKRQKIQTASLARVDQDYSSSEFPPDLVPEEPYSENTQINQAHVPRPPPRPPAPKVRTKSASPAISSPGIQNSPASGSIVKVEENNVGRDSASLICNSQDSSRLTAFQSQDLPPSVHLTHTQTAPPHIANSDGGTDPQDNGLKDMTQSGELSQEPTVKLELVGDIDEDLEITGVEMGSGSIEYEEDWGPDTSGSMGYATSETGDSPMDQSGNQYKNLPLNLGLSELCDLSYTELKGNADDLVHICGLPENDHGRMTGSMEDAKDSFCSDGGLLKVSEENNNFSSHEDDIDCMSADGKSDYTARNNPEKRINNNIKNRDDTLEEQNHEKSDNTFSRSVIAKQFEGYHKKLVVQVKRIKKTEQKTTIDDNKEIDASRTCKVCGWKGRNRFDVADHMVRHTGEKRYSCPKCLKKFKYRAARADHRRTCTGKVGRPIGRININKQNMVNKRNTVVSTANKTKTTVFQRIKSFPRKDSTYINRKNEKKSIDDRKCKFCGKIWSSYSRLLEHLPVHTGEKNYSCSICGMKFTWRSTATLHERQCGRSMVSKSLTSQVRSKRTKIRVADEPYESRLHQKQFKRVDSFSKHHMGASSYGKYNTSVLPKKKNLSTQSTRAMSTKGTTAKSCKVCEKKFFDSSKLIEHMVVHTGEKIFSCVKCGTKFKWRGQARTHRMQCGGEIINKFARRKMKNKKCMPPTHSCITEKAEVVYFSCDSCSMKFKFRKGLQVHIMRKECKIPDNGTGEESTSNLNSSTESSSDRAFKITAHSTHASTPITDEIRTEKRFVSM